MEPDRPATGPRVPGYLGAMKPSAGLPNIGDYWPDAPQRMGPAADVHEDPAAEPTRLGPSPYEQAVRTAQPEPPGGGHGRRRVRPLVVAAIAAVLLLLAGAMAYGKMADRKVTASPSPTATTLPVPPASSPAPIAVPPAPSASPTKEPTRTTPSPPPAVALGSASLQVLDGVDDLTLSSARVSGGIARVGVPDGSSATPRASTKGNAIQLSVGSRGRGSQRLIVQLDNRLSWAIRLGGHSRQMTVHLEGGIAVRSLAFDGKVGTLDLTVARLAGTLPIQLTGGLGRWQIETTAKVAVDVLARAGSGDIVLYGQDRGLLKPGKRTSVNGAAGLDIDASAGFGALTVSSA